MHRIHIGDRTLRVLRGENEGHYSGMRRIKTVYMSKLATSVLVSHREVLRHVVRYVVPLSTKRSRSASAKLQLIGDCLDHSYELVKAENHMPMNHEIMRSAFALPLGIDVATYCFASRRRAVWDSVGRIGLRARIRAPRQD